MRVGSHSSPVTSGSVGVPQGSVLAWTAAFSIYTSPIFTIIHMIFLHFSLVWTLFTFGFVKMA